MQRYRPRIFVSEFAPCPCNAWMKRSPYGQAMVGRFLEYMTGHIMSHPIWWFGAICILYIQLSSICRFICSSYTTVSHVCSPIPCWVGIQSRDPNCRFVKNSLRVPRNDKQKVGPKIVENNSDWMTYKEFINCMNVFHGSNFTHWWSNTLKDGHICWTWWHVSRTVRRLRR